MTVPRATSRCSGGRLGVLGGVLIASLLLGQVVWHGYVAAVATVAIAAIGLLAPWVLMRLASGRTIIRETRCTAGQCLQLTIQAHNRAPIPLPMVRLWMPERLATDSSAVPLPAGRYEQTIRVRAERRGRVRLDAIRWGTDEPFGLRTAWQPLAATGALLVWPVAEPVEPEHLCVAIEPRMDQVTSRPTGEVGESTGVRAYRRGDSIRRVHWQQTARHERLMVRERSVAHRRACHVALDTQRAAYANEAGFERAVALAAGALQTANRLKWNVRLLLGDRRIEINTPGDLPAAMDALATVELHDRLRPPPDAALLITGRPGAERANGRVLCAEASPEALA